jgi:hypothetical protein
MNANEDEDRRPVRLPAHLQRPSATRSGRHSVDHFESEQRGQEKTIGIVRPTKMADGGGVRRISAKSLQAATYRRRRAILMYGLVLLVIFLLLAVLLT